MNKRIFEILMILLLSISSLAAQSEVDIQKMVDSQIESAREKAANEKVVKSQNNLNAAQNTNDNFVVHQYTPENNSSASFDSGLLIKAGLLSAASVVVFTIVFLRRKKANVKSMDDQKLKSNIKMMRMERPYILQNSKMQKKRRKLTALAIPTFADSKMAPKMARKLNLSSGEIMLAASINMKLKNSSKNTGSKI